MPEPAGSRQIIALAMIASAVSLAVAAYLIYAGMIPMPEETRGLAAGVVGLAAFLDVLVGIWFFRKGQSS